ncbi:MAG TPA: HPF/RaiA family ribosome-associated protein [Burkholderiaceae bacterium]|jgi:ribosome-associated translation inhibitor RaiA|nr:HPF/RaiA family ribosome-associated protein [Burkholderiaceae bacterium]
MQVQTNTDDTVTGRVELAERVESIVESALDRFRDRITRVEVHLNDENKAKGGSDDKRCMMEARIKGLEPIAVTHHAGSLIEAIEGAADKLERAIDNRLGKLEDR